jgi:hypothetical protein
MTRSRGRKTILNLLHAYLTLDHFSCNGVEQRRTVETNFYALDEEIKKLRDLAGDIDSRTSPFEPSSSTVTAIRDAAERLALVVHDLKTRSVTPTDYVREKTRIWRESWIFPLIKELLAKEK